MSYEALGIRDLQALFSYFSFYTWRNWFMVWHTARVAILSSRRMQEGCKWVIGHDDGTRTGSLNGTRRALFTVSVFSYFEYRGSVHRTVRTALLALSFFTIYNQ